jgi:1,4-alpha-glucan branching enzyme
MIVSDIFNRKKSRFCLWLPGKTNPVPQLIIGIFSYGNPNTLSNKKIFDLTETITGLWEIDATKCNLIDGTVYHYWFKVTDGVSGNNGSSILVTDPFALTVDWRLLADPITGYHDVDRDPASVILFKGSELHACDINGGTIDWAQWPDEITPDKLNLPNNSQLAIYELPAQWIKQDEEKDISTEIGIGTFQDVLAMIDGKQYSPNFGELDILGIGKKYLVDLGFNALELLPIQDSWRTRTWGYATSNYLAPDYDLGKPEEYSSSESTKSLVTLIGTCHANNIRFFIDVVLSFAQHGPLENINFDDFYVAQAQNYTSANAEQRSSRPNEIRQNWGGNLFRYIVQKQNIYDPVSGNTVTITPARQFMLSFINRWINDFHIDGIRMDSLESIANWDFMQQFKDFSRSTYQNRWQNQANGDKHILVVGEELSVPLNYLSPYPSNNPNNKKVVDGLWNEKFKARVRKVILGQQHGEDISFEDTIRKLIDCRNLGFHDCTEAINYITSHDVGGLNNERLCDYLNNNNVVFKEKKIILAFCCLFTAVGIPMSLAGEEFADQSDLSRDYPYKMIDPVNYSRLQYALDNRNDPEQKWRVNIYETVSRLAKLRTSHPALANNETDFIHFDFNEGKRIIAWVRGFKNTTDIVITVANFSDWGSPDVFNSKYFVNNWPQTPPNKNWYEVTQGRSAPYAGMESIIPWEAKVYVLQ